MNLFHASVGLFRRLPELCSRFSGRRSLFAAVCLLVFFCLSATCSAVMRPVQEPADQPSVEEQPPEPRTLKDESESLDPTNKDALAWYMAGHKALKRGDLKEAADAFEKSAAAAPDSPIPLRARAMVLFRLGRAADGLAAAETAMKMDQDDWQTRLELAVAFFQNRQLGRAVELIEQAVASKSLNRKSLDFIQVHQVRSAIQLQLRNTGAAADSYEVILNALDKPEDFGLSQRDHANLLRNRATGYELTGRVLLEAGRTAMAIRAFEGLSRTQQDRPGEHHLLLARALYQQDKLMECEKNLDRYFETGKRSRESLALLRDLYENSSRSDALADRLKQLSETASRKSEVQLFLGQLLLDQGKAKEAGDVFREILQTSGEAEANVGLIRVAVAERDPAAVLTALNKASAARITYRELLPLLQSLETAEDFGRSMVSACVKSFEAGDAELQPLTTWFCAATAAEFELSEQQGLLLKATLELEPDQELMLETLDKYAGSLLVAGEYQQAARIFEQMLAQPGLPDGARVNALFRIAIAYGALKDLKAARTAIRQALQILPNEPQLLMRLAAIEAMDGKLEVAEGILLGAVAALEGRREERGELLIDARLQLAGVYSRRGQWENAAEQYDVLLQMENVPKEVIRSVKMGLSNALVQGGDMARGEKVLEEVYQEDPQDPGVNNDLGYLYADQGKNLEQAEKMIRLAVQNQPENPAYLDSLGWVLFKLGRNEEALEALKKANGIPDYEDSTLLEHQGDVHQAMQQADDAKKLWQKAAEVEEKETSPDKAVLKRLREKLGN